MMKNTGIALLLLSSAWLYTGCSTAEPEETAEESTVKECYYTYNAATTELTWTAYKFNEKTPVSGTFNEIRVSGDETMNSAEDLLLAMSFEIPVNSVNSQNPERDGKIQEHFFGTMANTAVLNGKLSKLNNGKATLELTMNTVTSSVEGSYTLEDGKFAFTGIIDLTKFNGQAAVKKLNDICYDLHIGKDGVSKLWDEVELKFSTALKQDCQ
jgi:polyisoprenoid-binding protein YceI